MKNLTVLSLLSLLVTTQASAYVYISRYSHDAPVINQARVLESDTVVLSRDAGVNQPFVLRFVSDKSEVNQFIIPEDRLNESGFTRSELYREILQFRNDPKNHIKIYFLGDSTNVSLKIEQQSYPFKMSK